MGFFPVILTEPTSCGLHESGGLDAIESIEVHDFVPRRDEIANELLLRVGAGVDLGEARISEFDPIGVRHGAEPRAQSNSTTRPQVRQIRW